MFILINVKEIRIHKITNSTLFIYAIHKQKYANVKMFQKNLCPRFKVSVSLLYNFFFYNTSKLTENIKRIGKAKRSQQVSVVHVIIPTYPFRLMLKFIATLSMDIFLTFWLTIFLTTILQKKSTKNLLRKTSRIFTWNIFQNFFFLIISVILLN